MSENKNIIIYQNGEIEIKVSVDNDTIWLSADSIAKLFDVQRPAIVKHISNIYKTNELSKISTCSILEQVAKDGKKRKKNYYNLDMIISVGYRVNSIRATQFRIWATSVLKRYIFQGFAINTEKITHQRFKELENDVLLLKHKVNDISKTIEDKSIKPRQGVFFNGQIFDAYTFVSDIIKTAKQSIILFDNYIDDTVLIQFTKRRKNVTFTVYTKNISKQLQLDIKKHNEQYPPIEIKVFKKAHDRFLVIDEKDVYHFGASLKDLGKKWFAFSKMDVSSVKILDRIKQIQSYN
jgi:prophage antirepressor-like protein